MTISLSEAFYLGTQQVLSASRLEEHQTILEKNTMATQTILERKTIATQTKRKRKPFEFTPLPTVEPPKVEALEEKKESSSDEPVIRKTPRKKKKKTSPAVPVPKPPLAVATMSLDELNMIIKTSEDLDHMVQAREEIDRRERQFTSAVLMDRWIDQEERHIASDPTLDVTMNVTVNSTTFKVPVMTIHPASSPIQTFSALQNKIEINQIPREERCLVLATLALERVHDLNITPTIIATMASYMEGLGYFKDGVNKIKNHDAGLTLRDRLFALVVKIHFINFWCGMVTARCETALAVSAFVDIIPKLDEPLLSQPGMKGMTLLETGQLLSVMCMLNGPCDAIRIYKEVKVMEKLKDTTHPELQVTMHRLDLAMQGFSTSLQSRLYLVGLFPSFAGVFEQFSFASPPSLTFLLSTEYFKELFLECVVAIQKSGRFIHFKPILFSSLEFRFMPVLMEMPDVISDIYKEHPYCSDDAITFHSFAVLTEANVFRVIVSLMEPDCDHSHAPKGSPKELPLLLAWTFVKGLGRTQRSISVKELHAFIQYIISGAQEFQKKSVVDHAESTINILTCALKYYRSSL